MFYSNIFFKGKRRPFILSVKKINILTFLANLTFYTHKKFKIY